MKYGKNYKIYYRIFIAFILNYKKYSVYPVFIIHLNFPEKYSINTNISCKVLIPSSAL